MPLGGGIAGALVGVRTTVFLTAIGQTSAALWLIFSPLFGMRDVPTATAESASS